MFNNSDIAEYYDTTQIHYERWWKLRKSLSLHYGTWDKGIHDLSAALENTNRVLMELSKISEHDKVLDAGCGVGGAAFYLNKKRNIEVNGISLSNKQINLANKIARQNNLTDKVSFHVMDFTQTTFDNESFDVVWACESVCHCEDKAMFVKEAYRVLKKGGRLILSDFCLTEDGLRDKHKLIKRWGNSWSVSNFISASSFSKLLNQEGFSQVQILDHTSKIEKSAKRLYYASILGAIPSILYNKLHPKISRFAKSHYKCGYYQYRALKKNLWRYNIVLAIKR